jgi:hypothetical protein
MAWESAGDAGRGGSLEADRLLADRLLEDLLLLERPPGEWRWPSSTTGDTGLFALACLLEVPLSRALLEGGVSIVVNLQVHVTSQRLHA